jgi:hypothetical protein
MTLGLFFWVVYIIAILFGVWSNYAANDPLWTRRFGAYGILWLLVGVLGWANFGPPVHR